MSAIWLWTRLINQPQAMWGSSLQSDLMSETGKLTRGAPAWLTLMCAGAEGAEGRGFEDL